MAHNDYLDLAERIAREGDKTQKIRRTLFEASVDAFLDDVTRQTREKVADDRRRGIVKRIA